MVLREGTSIPLERRDSNSRGQTDSRFIWKKEITAALEKDHQLTDTSQDSLSSPWDYSRILSFSALPPTYVYIHPYWEICLFFIAQENQDYHFSSVPDHVHFTLATRKLRTKLST